MTSPLLGRTAVALAAVLTLAACTAGTPAATTSASATAATTSAPAPAASPTPTPTASTPAEPAPAPSATVRPGDPCDPAAGDPDCTDATVDGTFRHVEGYADCVASFGDDEAYGLCQDLDGDGEAMYPDSH
ncbi:hypothetical protein [Cellulomonas fimi]|uniref:Uncharacterized protein n=1 Tax=Cellulomonas fimi (strain ATCC 484 / DSM 20113 / JCM 1341 / CCUG 24087 / LMG 16345 / NBRC 15513 / NCIMB 8980 / NCTC 7547 / NRS-133) TaxID=590998 RepID=F4H1W6_CELFA|nr:hypothetical protein [Cellulomonas fimi]AEE45136.1 hypothetical protein Celf_0999 [Cellulomonas fimi ATCC 484]NNH06301.1 hypothetical protein [Cellulomonas fimi]VEH28349.1 Uncharacterised protein [Cellulomonas fimi]